MRPDTRAALNVNRRTAYQNRGDAVTITPDKPDHDYEPGDEYHPMHTDPLCRICGQPKH